MRWPQRAPLGLRLPGLGLRPDTGSAVNLTFLPVLETWGQPTGMILMVVSDIAQVAPPGSKRWLGSLSSHWPAEGG